MIYAGTRPPDRAERARARAERAPEAQPVEPSEGPPEVGRQRAWNQPLEGAIDIVINGTPVGQAEVAGGQVPGEPPLNL
jgi:hypothetical protein